MTGAGEVRNWDALLSRPDAYLWPTPDDSKATRPLYGSDPRRSIRRFALVEDQAADVFEAVHCPWVIHRKTWAALEAEKGWLGSEDDGSPMLTGTFAIVRGGPGQSDREVGPTRKRADQQLASCARILLVVKCASGQCGRHVGQVAERYGYGLLLTGQVMHPDPTGLWRKFWAEPTSELAEKYAEDPKAFGFLYDRTPLQHCFDYLALLGQSGNPERLPLWCQMHGPREAALSRVIAEARQQLKGRPRVRPRSCPAEEIH